MPTFDSNHPADFGWSAYGGPRAAHIAPYSYQGIPFPSGIADILAKQATHLLDLLVPTINGGLHNVHDVNQNGEWGFENRANVNSPNQRSFHSYGLALDLNAPWNGTTPAPAARDIPGSPGAAAVCRSIGWLHGGEWGDPMHIECHNSPAEVLSWNAAHGGDGEGGGGGPVPAGAFPLPAGYYYGPLSGPTQSISGLAHEDPAWIAGLRAAQARLDLRGALQVACDGAYGPQTAAATRAFQSHVGLPADGLIGSHTWAALFAKSTVRSEQNALAGAGHR